MKRVALKVKHTDDYRSGPSLNVVDNIQNDSEEEKEEEEGVDLSYEVDDKHFFVYQAQINQCGCGSTVKLLGKFDNYETADKFAKKIYTIITGDAPFIQDGIDTAYHPTGKRERIEEEEEEEDKYSFLEDNHEDEPYLLVVADDLFETHSLNPFAVW